MTPDEQRRIRVLIADDHRLFAESLRLALAEDERIDVVGLAHTGRDAVELVRELVPDVVVMDIDMPIVDGIEATRQIRAGGGPTAVLILTGTRSRASAETARAAGAAGFLTKDRTIAALFDSFYEVATLTIAFERRKRS